MMRIQRDVPYSSQANHLRMDMYLPTLDQPVPAVLLLHGGGWTTGNKNDDVILKYVNALVEAGLGACPLSYGLAPARPWPAHIQDCRTAVRFLRANGDRYGVAPAKLGVMGSSAGGQLALLQSMDGLPEEWSGHEYSDEDESVQAVAAFSSVVDLDDCSQTLREGRFPMLFDSWTRQATQAASPINYSGGTAPVLLVHGENDPTIPISSIRKMRDHIRAQDRSCDFIEVMDGGHGLDMYTPNSSPNLAQLQARLTQFFGDHLL